MGLFDFMKKKKEEEEDFLNMGSPTAGFGGAAGPASPQGMGPAFSQPPQGFDQPGFNQQDMGMGDLAGMAPAAQPMSMPARQQMPQGNVDLLNERLQTLSYKIDALKSTLDSMNARLANIEQAMRGKEGQQGWSY